MTRGYPGDSAGKQTGPQEPASGEVMAANLGNSLSIPPASSPRLMQALHFL